MTVEPSGPSSAEQLLAIVQRLEQLDSDSAAINAEKREVRTRAQNLGFDLPTIRRLLERRRMDPQAVLEADALLETYEQALGCGAAAAGVLSTERNADGTFEVRMAPQAPEEKLTRAQRARRDAIAAAELARWARDRED